MTEYSVEYQRSLDRRARAKSDLAAALADADNQIDHPRPFRAILVVHDGPGIQIFDANDRPVLTELLRDPEDAASLLYLLNRAADGEETSNA
jgi:hypothetical protein